MTARADTADFRALFLAGAPLLDVRAPVEFGAGSFPGAENVPILTDDERAQVGTMYKREGQQAAIALGHRLVNDAVKRERVARWCDFARRHPDGYLYCFRGGLRSQTARQWMREAGVDYPLVTGGYKALRQFLIAELERIAGNLRLGIVGGRTGSGKTRAIHALARPIVDLEALARHRGSSFGRLPGGQPTQIDFENALAIALMRAEVRQRQVWLEDESRLIGRCAIPLALRPRMEEAPLALIEEPLEARVQVVLEDYVVDGLAQYRTMHGEDGFDLYAGALRGSLDRVQRRLGGLMHRQAALLMDNALAAQRVNGDIEGHRGWIALLLNHYYDPMYDWQLAQKKGAVVFRGRRAEVIDWINRQEH